MFRNLEAEMIRAGITKEKLSKELGISNKTLYNRLSGCADWSMEEMKKTQAIINISLQQEYTLDYLFKS